ncbi:MAG TPA: SAM-dependent chlorinase/fluorinase [Micromonosporaceae bacterium]|nr:SAM-dependent chlorinase/fluorinase [Micromonosporaceae bacterium]
MGGYDWISLTTDYGLSDGFVASCRGVIARIAPSARVIDITHLVAPGDVARGAAVLAQTVPHLPVAVHVGIVDPGVGSARRAVAIETPNGALVGPDNGLLAWAMDTLGGPVRAVELVNPAWFGPTISHTFHGRDVFAPAAARLAFGVPIGDAGPAIDPGSLVRLPDPVLMRGDRWVEAEVLTVDRFGNVQLAAGEADLAGLADPLTVGGIRAIRGTTYADASSGGLVVYVDSADQVAVAVNGGRAAVVLAVIPGDVLRLSGG